MDKKQCQTCAKEVATEVLATDVKYIKESVIRLEKSLTSELSSLENHIKDQLNTKADKWIELPVKGVIAIMLTALIIAIVGMAIPV